MERGGSADCFVVVAEVYIAVERWLGAITMR